MNLNDHTYEVSMISLNHFAILLAAVLFPAAIASAAEEDPAPQTKQTRYEQLAVHAVRQLLFDDSESARTLSSYYSLSESESKAEISALVESRSDSRQWRRNTYSAMKTAELENIRARYFRSIDAVMANGKCDVSGSASFPRPAPASPGAKSRSAAALPTSRFLRKPNRPRGPGASGSPCWPTLRR